MSRMIFLIIALSVLIGCQSSPVPDLNKPVSEKTALNQTPVPRDFSAHWVAPDVLLLPQRGSQVTHVLVVGRPEQLLSYKLQSVQKPAWLEQQHPHLMHLQAFEFVDRPQHETPAGDSLIRQWLKQPLSVISIDADNRPVHIASVQTAALIDVLYTRGDNDADEAEDLGAVSTNDGVSFKLWAPTARRVALLLFNDDKSPAAPARVTMREDARTGIWQARTDTAHAAAFYRYEIEVYHPASRRIETLVTTDPYSLSLATNSRFSQVVNLDGAVTKPPGWDTQRQVTVGAPENHVLYEVHIRDFSAHDPLLANAQARGKYEAFSESNSAGIKHLKTLQRAGINTIHLLPAFDIGTVNEDSRYALDFTDPLAKLCRLLPDNAVCTGTGSMEPSINELLSSFSGNSTSQQQIVSAIRMSDNYNWGYDPYHYTVPEGSYATNPDGYARIIEFRQMVQSLHNLGFRVIMDVVYNHTHQAGLEPTAVLDKIVPNYYHRLDPVTGEIAQSTCCDNTATERVMMAKLMIDSLVVWARDYKIDGFRFDLMGHQPKTAMLKARAAVRAVDTDTYFYGEGWNFGEVANNQRFVQASQTELGGTEIGTFTDRLRDAVRGGAFSASGNAIRTSQGIGSGLGTLPNELVDSVASTRRYLEFADQLRVGLAGNLAEYPLENARGENVTGKDILYGGQPAGYALDPADTINYVSKHDNQTLWDNHQYRLPFATSTHDRVRLHLQSLAFVAFAQGIPFFHMGSELLRSKSFLRDSYDYGDWFNKVDFTKQGNNYDVGLPPVEKDAANWPLIRRLLAQNEHRDHVSPADIKFSSAVFNEFVSIRMSTALFRLTSAEDIIARVRFHNTGTGQQPGLIVMTIDDGERFTQLDDAISKVVVIFNTSSELAQVAFENASSFRLHPVQQHSIDRQVAASVSSQRGFSVPPFTTAVFVHPD